MRRLVLLLSLFVLLTVVALGQGSQRVYVPLAMRPGTVTAIATPSVIPALTVTLAATPLATPSPSPAPTYTTSPDVYLLPNDTNYLSPTGHRYFVAEIRNDLGSDISPIGVGLTLYNADGHSVGYYGRPTYPARARAGETVCWIVGRDEASGGEWVSYEYEQPTFALSSTPIMGLAAVGVVVSQPDPHVYQLEGYWRNDTIAYVGDVQVGAMVYDAEGNILDCVGSYAPGFELGAGEERPFSFTFYGRSTYSDVASYHVQALGYEMPEPTVMPTPNP